MEHPLIQRYTPDQQCVINEYWDTIRWTRSTGKIADGVKLKELDFWSKYPAAIVIQALHTHIQKHPNVKEHYTRGIIRNLSKGSSAKPGPPANQRHKPVIPIVQPDTSEESVSEEEYAALLELAESLMANK